MSDVSVIGAGAMGSALVVALAASGTEVTVWNRTPEKAAALSGPRVRLAESAGEALLSSPLTIVSTSDHEVGRRLVEEADRDLDGRVVASTSFVTPEQAQAFRRVVGFAGGAYLDLEIIAYPGQVREGDGIFLFSGEHAAYEAHHDRFERIGRASHVSESPAAAYISGMAVLVAYFPLSVGLLQGLRIVESEGLSPDWFKEAVLDLYPFHIKTLLDRVIAQSGTQTSDVEASVDVMSAAAAEYGSALRDMGLDSGMYDALHRLFTAASEAGHGEDDWICVAEHVAAPSA